MLVISRSSSFWGCWIVGSIFSRLQVFAACTHFSSLTECNAFNGCTMLGELYLPEGLQSILGMQCCSFTHLAIPSTVEIVVDRAFTSCKSLKEIQLCEGLLELKDWMSACCCNRSWFLCLSKNMITHFTVVHIGRGLSLRRPQNHWKFIWRLQLSDSDKCSCFCLCYQKIFCQVYLSCRDTFMQRNQNHLKDSLHEFASASCESSFHHHEE